MLSDRLSIALSRGLVTVPETGAIGIFGARVGDDLGLLPKDRLQVITRHYPDHAHFAQQGYKVTTEAEGRFALTLVVLPRAKDEARDLIARGAGLSDGPLVVDGQKTDGIDSLIKELRARGTVEDVISKAHGKIAILGDVDCAEWIAAEQPLVGGRFRTGPGVFSADGVDPGSALLAEALPRNLKGHVVDLGAGWGYLTDAILSRESVVAVDLVEADHAALDAARENITDPRAHFHWADARDYLADAPVDYVVTNPPFHTGRKADASLGHAFIRQAAAILKPKGALWLVANRHLPYEAVLKDAFAETRVLDETPSYKIFHATSPRRPRKG